MRRVRANSLGWQLDKAYLSYGYIIRKSESWWKTIFLGMGCFWLNIILVVCLWMFFRRDLCYGAILGLPFNFWLSYYYFRDVHIYFNTRKKMVIDGRFYHRFAFVNLSVSIAERKNLFYLLLINKKNADAYISWEAEDRQEVWEVGEILRESMGAGKGGDWIIEKEGEREEDYSPRDEDECR